MTCLATKLGDNENHVETIQDVKVDCGTYIYRSERKSTSYTTYNLQSYVLLTWSFFGIMLTAWLLGVPSTGCGFAQCGCPPLDPAQLRIAVARAAGAWTPAGDQCRSQLNHRETSEHHNILKHPTNGISH